MNTLRIAVATLLCLVCGSLRASVGITDSTALKYVDELSFEARGGFHQEFGGGRDPDGIFTGDYFNFIVAGHLSYKFSYRIRQRLIKEAYDEHNIFNATDFLWIKWQAAPNFSLTFGKQPIFVGGYEYDATPIDVYYWSKFSSGLYHVYAFGLSGDFRLARGQDLILEFCESPLSRKDFDTFALNLLWNGHIAPWWSTLWSLNAIQDDAGGKMGYIALGNRLYLGPVTFDLDLMSRDPFERMRPFTDWSAICKIIWNIGKWNICTKFGREVNSIKNVDDYGNSYDIAFPAGSEFSYAGAGLEYFPLKDDRLRLHGVWYWNTDGHDRNNFDIGITWRMRLVGAK